MTAFDETTLAELAPTGRLRAAINLGNAALARKGAEGQLEGISPDLARELARQTGLELEMITYQGAGKTFADVEDNVWDVAFLAVDETRARKVDYTAPYVEIEGTYAVPADSPFQEIDQLDVPHAKILVAQNSAYDLYLSTALEAAEIVRAETPGASLDQFDRGGHDAVAGVRQTLEARYIDREDINILPGSFISIFQAMCVPKGRDNALAALSAFIEDAKGNGFIAEHLQANGDKTVKIAAPAG
ncbi:transporter substrate-binding domain-containing protein [Notoacmeibacter sp. MSK16QG-6]|uniref:transporter substrate-binding domain-containing protein n=1 Tax=Notoacmeibacter sp. MSK16QG-6 TaxID=2957982 RepID=UPI00209E4ECF|nr:transporter substrate-binding domain-containing protein [Notoacmeibacter sp. MSK16QG-6]MCP1199597.1 transporter substrate-binding domain-containing protein [Notoacmeibacter sp. MSK16QG-6]